MVAECLLSGLLSDCCRTAVETAVAVSGLSGSVGMLLDLAVWFRGLSGRSSITVYLCSRALAQHRAIELRI